MIYLRLIFACILLGLSVMLARMKVQKLNMRAKALGDFTGFVRHLEVLIRVNGRPIPDALAEYSQRFAAVWTGAFSGTLASLYQKRPQASGIWDAALAETARDSEEAASLAPEDRQIIALFGDQLASSDMKSIGENYTFLYGRIGENLHASDRDKAVKGKLYNTIGMLAGLAAAIIVL